MALACAPCLHGPARSAQAPSSNPLVTPSIGIQRSGNKLASTRRKNFRFMATTFPLVLIGKTVETDREILIQTDHPTLALSQRRLEMHL